MLAFIDSHRTLIWRMLPIAGVVALLAVLIPSDFSAVADVMSRPAVVTERVAIKRSVPAPKVIIQPTMTKPLATASTAQRAAARPWVSFDEITARAQVVRSPQSAGSAPSGSLSTRIASAVNMRTGPSKSAATIGILQAGTPVRTAEAVRGWVHVYTQTGDGWVYSTYLAGPSSAMQPRIAKYEGAFPDKNAAAAIPSSKAKLKVQSAVRVYSAPGADPIYRLSAGEKVKVVEVRGKWARIITSSGESGWVRIR